MASEFTVGNAKLVLMEGDITRIPADAIVNAANSRLAGGGGVDGAIHRAGGPEIMRELDAIRSRVGRCPPGDAVLTAAGRLPAKYIIHAVGPVYQDGKHGKPDQLASCYRTALRLAQEAGAETLTFPAISTGVYRYPVADAAAIAIRAVAEALAAPGNQTHVATFVLFGGSAYETFVGVAREILQG